MNLSALRKRTEPAVESLPQQQRQYHPDVAKMFDTIATTRDERDRLAEENAELHEQLHSARRAIDFLTTKLREVDHDRSFYERHYYALRNRLGDMGILNNTATSEAASEARAAGMTPEAAKVAAVEAVDEALNGDQPKES
jgi:chromosome segregation ATPase